MHSRLLAAAAMLCCISAFLPANAQDAKLQALLDEKNKQVDDALIKGDLTPVLNLMSPDVRITNPVGGFVGRDEFVQTVKSGTLKYTSIQPSEEKLAQYGNVAIVTYLSNETGTMQGHDISGKYRYTEVWAKQSGQWQIVAVQLTAVVPKS